jgi:hypothetical protein
MNKTGEVNKFNLIIQICRVTMYLLVGLVIVFVPIPLFKNGHPAMRIILGLLFVLYSVFRGYQVIQKRKNESKNDE